MDPDTLFPVLPEDLTALNDEELSALLEEHEVALSKIEADDPTYIGDMSAEEVLAQLEQGVDQIKQITELQKARVEAEVAYQTAKAERIAEVRPAAEVADETEGGDDEGDDEGGDDEGDEVTAEAEAEVEDEPEAEEVVEDREAILVASVEDKPEPAPAVRRAQPVYRRPVPSPDSDRAVAAEESNQPHLTAASGVEGVRSGVHLDSYTLAKAMIDYVSRRSPPSKHPHGVEEKLLVASAQYNFPEERRLIDGDHANNVRKIRAIGNPYLGNEGARALVASGGLCAPLTPLYDIPDLAVNDRPVRDALPSFQAERGGVSVPSVSTIGDITTAITVIEEEGDAAGGTFATKSCQDLTCPTWTDVAIGIISHCREYGNLNARAWPEGISHENAITMAAHARTAEARLLDRIKALSINVTGGAATLSAWSHFVYRNFHHEPFDPKTPVWEFPATGPLSAANGALPWIMFERDRRQFEQEFPEWRVRTIEPQMPFRYLVSGGVSLRGLAPDATYRLWEGMERLLQPWMHTLAMFARIVLERAG